MTTLRTAAQQALEAIYGAKLCEFNSMSSRSEMIRLMNAAITILEAALAEPTGKDSLQVEPTVAENATAEFDHSIGADRFRVVRGAFWWHVLIGDSTTEHGKFRTKASAEKMAADLLREFRSGAFVQHQGGGNLPPPLQEATVQQQLEDTPPSDYRRGYWDGFNIGKREGRIEAEDALAEPVQEPYTDDVTRIMREAGMTFHLGLPHKAVVEQMSRVVDLVYAEASIKAAQQFAAAPPQRKPLTDEEIKPIVQRAMTYYGYDPERYGLTASAGFEVLARAIERAHGIGGTNESA